MPRIARGVAVGLPQHIAQRGNYRQDVFFDADDSRQYLAWRNVPGILPAKNLKT